MHEKKLNLYRFSPIESEDQFFEALEYIVSAADQLAQEVLGESLPINTVKVFAHYYDEYKYLLDLVSRMGNRSQLSSETSYYVEIDKEISRQAIQYLGVRIVDPYRLHVGCADYEIQNYHDLKDAFLKKGSYVRSIENGEMLELWHPDTDVLGYVVPPFV